MDLHHRCDTVERGNESRRRRSDAHQRPESRGQPVAETAMGFYAQVIVPLLCDFGLDQPFVARYRRELLADASGTILEIGFGTGPPWQGRSTVPLQAAEVYLILCEVDLPRLPPHHGWRPPAQTL